MCIIRSFIVVFWNTSVSQPGSLLGLIMCMFVLPHCWLYDAVLCQTYLLWWSTILTWVLSCCYKIINNLAALYRQARLGAHEKKSYLVIFYGLLAYHLLKGNGQRERCTLKLWVYAVCLSSLQNVLSIHVR